MSLSSGLTTPCPPYYSIPTHSYHPHYSQNAFVRHYNDWYECLLSPYCNSPTFLGYNPPGEGDKWEQAWRLLAEGEGYPCNPNLETSTGGGDDNNDNGSSGSGTNNINFILTPPPSPRPTTILETPSLISGAVWYDVNGDGLKNTIQNALTTADREAAQQERGGGAGNMKVMLRRCEDDMLLGVTYTFPRQSGTSNVDSSGVQIVGADYLAEITEQLQFGSIDGESELGFGNVNNELGYFSFRVLPSYLPGNFYVVFEAPEGYRLSGGSGEYWEVHEAEMNDVVQPVMEASWKEQGDDERFLQGVNGTINDDNTTTVVTTTSNNNNDFNIPLIPSAPDKINFGPINHSGYYARSKGCLFIKESPTTIANINCGISKDSWPLESFQYASFVIMIEFFAPSARRGLQKIDSLECRKYQKLKGEGVDVEDIWGCETELDAGGGKQFEFTELDIEQADLVINSLNDFLLLRAPRAWSIKNVHLVWQEVVEFNVGDERRLLDVSSSDVFQEQDIVSSNNNRGLQNQQLAQLELGIRVRAESLSDKAKNQDLAEVVMASIDANPTTLLSTLKANVNVMPPYFRLAGGLTMRRIMWKPPTPAPTPVPRIDEFPDSSLVESAPTLPPVQPIGGGQMMIIIGIVSALAILVAGCGIVVGMYLWRKRKAQLLERRKSGFGEDYDDDSLSSRWYSDYEGSDAGENNLTDDEEEEDSFGDFDELGLGPISNIGSLDNMNGSMRVSFKASPQNGSMRGSFRSQKSGSRQGSMRGSMRSAAMSSMRSSGKSSRSMSEASFQSQRSGGQRSSMRGSMRSMRSASMASMRSSGRSSRSMSRSEAMSSAASSRDMRSEGMSSATGRSSRDMRSGGMSSATGRSSRDMRSEGLSSAGRSSRGMRSEAQSSRSMHSSARLSVRSGEFT